MVACSGSCRGVLVRATASVVSPLGWRQSDIEDELGRYTESSLAAFD
jgi:DNA polymerase I